MDTQHVILIFDRIITFISFMICTSHQILLQSRMKWALHVACIGELKGKKGVWWGDLTKRNHLDRLGEYGKTKLKWIFKKKDKGGFGLF